MGKEKNRKTETVECSPHRGGRGIRLLRGKENSGSGEFMCEEKGEKQSSMMKRGEKLGGNEIIRMHGRMKFGNEINHGRENCSVSNHRRKQGGGGEGALKLNREGRGDILGNEISRT